jgi:hypothetical protein
MPGRLSPRRTAALLPACTLGSLAVLALGAAATVRTARSPELPSATHAVKGAFLQRPLSFEENRGQAGRQARFVSRGPGFTLALSPTQALISVAQGGREATPARRASIRLRLENANRTPRLAGVEKQRGIVNYFLGNDPKQWRTRIPTFAKVKYESVYPGIDLVYHGTQGSLEYDFNVAPGADPNQIRLSTSGAEKVELSPMGDLLLHLPGGTVTQRKPVADPQIDGRRVEVAARFTLDPSSVIRHPSPNHAGFRDASRITDDASQSAIRNPRSAIASFQLARYDATRPLVIDPVLAFSTYFGGSADDQVQRITVDSSGCAYVVGKTQSTDFGTVAPYDDSNGGSYDAFVAKLSADATYFVYSTYLGGSGSDIGNGIAVDSSGSAHVTGTTASSDYPTTSGAYDTSHNTNNDVFVTKLSADGSALGYSTFIGGASDDQGLAIAVGSDGAAYLTGRTSSSGYPRVNPFDNSLSGTDAFATKLAAGGASITYSTLLGGTSTEQGNAIAVDASGYAYLTGWTLSASMPLQNSYDGTANGQSDAWVIKVNPAGNTLRYSTYLGAEKSDSGNGIAVDSSGVAYVTGYTTATDLFPRFPTVNAYQSAIASISGGTDAFVASFSSDGWNLTYSTFLGGSGNDVANDITLGSDGSMYVTGKTASSDFPTLNAFQGSLSGGQDAFATRIASGGASLKYSSYLGGTGTDEGLGIAVDASANTYVGGLTTSDDLSLVAALDSTRGGNEGFIALLEPGFFAPTGLTVAEGTNGRPKLTWNDNCDEESGYEVERALPGGSFSLAFTTAQNVHSVVEDTTATPGYIYQYRVRAYDATQTSGYTDEVTFTPAAPTAPSGVTAALDGTGAVVQISWTDNSSSELTFYLQRSLNDTDWTTVSTVAAGTTSATDSSLQDGATTLYYRVVAENQGGSNASTSASLTLAPTNLTVTEGASQRPVLSWTDNTLDETSFRIERLAIVDLTSWSEVLTSGANEQASIEDTTAVVGVAYMYRVRAARPGCYTGYSNETTFTPAAPAAPTNLVAVPSASGTSVALSWADNSNNERAFLLQRSTDGVTWDLLTTAGSDTTSATDPNSLDGTTTVYYQVTATNDGGSSASASASLSIAPTNLTVVEGADGKPVLSWDDNGTYETSFRIERMTVFGVGGFTEVLSTAANTHTAVADTSATPGIAYSYRVRGARGTTYSGYSNLAFHTPSVPDAPSGLSAQTSAAGGSVALSWTDNSNNETAFLVQRSSDGGATWEPLTLAAVNATSATDSTVAAVGTYYYQVLAANETGTSGSEIVEASPRAPSDLTAQAVSGTAIELAWTDNSWNEDGFELERKVGSGSYRLLADLPADTRTYRHTALASNTTYTYRIRSYCESVSAWAGPASATTFTDAPSAPGSLQVFSPDRGHVVLTWIDNSLDESGFRVYRRVGASGAYSLLTTLAADTNTYTDATTTGDTKYAYTVSAYNDRGVSASTKEQGVTTLWGPESLTASAVTTAQVNLSWKDMSLYEDGYSIERQKAGGSYVEVARASGKTGKNQTLSYTDTGLVSRISYTYRVRAYNTNATSLYATGSSITTTGAPAPSLQVTPTSKSYGRVPRGQARTATFRVKNAGKKREAVTVAGLGGAFEVLGSRHFTLAAGASRTFNVRFTGKKPGLYQADLPVRCQHGEVVRVKLDGRSIRE